LRRLRRRLYPRIHGRTLELGVGTGVNLPLYPPQTELVAVDLRAAMLRRATLRRRPAQALYVQADAEALPFAEAAFEHVTTSLLLCSVRDPARALGEIQRVLRPGGCLLMLEHVRGEGWLMRHLTDWLDRPWYRMNGSCHLNRDTHEAVRASGLEIVSARRHVLGIVQVIHARRVA
ncbi:MAG: class I SAM-dependent methyltransferase, partial [Chloroflexota bacterium]